MRPPLLTSSFILLTWTAASVAAATPFSARPPAEVTRTMDRDQMMAQVGVAFPTDLPPRIDDPNRPAGVRPTDPANPEANWTDENGNVVVRGGFGLWTWYPNEQPFAYPPVDLLKMNDGTPVTTAEQWWNQRRPEILHDVQDQLYGFLPPPDQMPAVRFAVQSTVGGDLQAPYVEQTLTGTVDTSMYPEVRDAPLIKARLRFPAFADRPVPVIILIGTRGFETLYDQFIAPEGWALCAYDINALQPDDGQYLTSYLIGLVNRGNWRRPTDAGQLVAGAWGISRLIDHLETNANLDPGKIGITGHSRWGKATAVAMALEPRLALAYPSCAGALGASLIRRHWGQNLENLSWDREYHWINGKAFTYMGEAEPGHYLPRKVLHLTVDAHSLLALAAPRPVFLNGGTTDTWSDAPGTFLAGVAASPVYKALGARGLVAPAAGPEVDVSYDKGDLAFRVHDGGHTPLPDWPAFVTFAKKYFE